MQKTVNFKKKIIVSAIASAIGFSGVAFAQDEAEEIVVTGIKASLTRAMDIKRDAAGVVDAISAEDIGKMPDANLAESLQRISGVSIDRSNGEGSKVTVRGLSGDYNLVTVNGRQMPASSQSTGGASQTRSFDFANLASEGVAGVSVYKTGRADIASGGMGAVIDIQTPHPLKTPGLKATVGAKAVLDDSSQKSDVTPEVSGLFSDTFFDDTLGVAVAGSYQERNFGNRQANTAGWFSHSATGNDWGELPASARPTGATTLYANPINIGYQINESNRTRTNLQTTVQYKPVESLTATVDAIYVKQEVETESHSMGAWFNRAEPMAITWSGGANKYPLIYSETNPLSGDGTEPKDFDFSAGLTNRQNELNSVGINLVWEASDHLKLEFDKHHSTSESGPGSQYGTENGFDGAAFVNYNPSVDYSGDFPVFSLKGQPGVAVNADPARVQITNNYFKKAEQDSTVNQTQIKAEYTLDDSVLKAIRVGFNKAEISNASKWIVINGQNKGSWNNTHQEGDVPDSLWHVDKLSNYFDASEVSRAGAQNEFITFNFKEALAVGAKLYGVDTANAANPCVRDYCTSPDWVHGENVTDQRVVETTEAGYIQGEFGTELNSMPVHILAGLRYESTDVDAKSLLPVNKSNIVWKGGNEFAMDSVAGKSDFLKAGGHYDLVLPSLDYDIEVVEGVKARFSYSKTLARPNYNQIRGGQVINSVRIAKGEGVSGNPDLDPQISSNMDASVEWYYGDASYVSLGYFTKDLKSFIGTDLVDVKNSGFHTPVKGDRWNAAIASGIAESDAGAIRDYIIAHTAASDTTSVDRVNKWVYAVDTDPVLPFTYTQPVNNKDLGVHGIEATIQQTFGDSGFGVIANYTKVDGDANFKDELQSTQFAIYGMSDSANLVGFYEKNGIQARLAYNWRDEFLASVGGDDGANPRYTDPYGQLDATASYAFNENLTVSFEALNLLNDHTRQHSREYHQLINYTETGARYNVGVRYTF